MNIVFVCTGSINRSPAAAEILTQLSGSLGKLTIQAQAISDYNNGKPPTTKVIRALDRAGYKTVMRHRSSPITVESFNQADLVICMTRKHKAELIRRYADADKIKILTEFLGNEDGIRDPHGKTDVVFDEVISEIDKCVMVVCSLLRKGKL